MMIEAYTKEVDKSLDNLIVLMSPEGATAFLGAEIGPYLRKRAGERFASEGDDVTGAWAQLKPATVAIRGEAHPINHDTGELENWVVDGGWDAYPSGGGAAMQFPKSPPAGRLKKKVQSAQVGDPSNNQVARPVLGVNEADLAFMVTAYAFMVEKAIV